MYFYVDQEALYQNIKYYDPEAGIHVLGRGHFDHAVKMHYIFRNLLL